MAWAEVYFRISSGIFHPSSPLATIDMSRKLGAVPFLGGAGSPANTKSPGSRPTTILSGILVHPAVWPQRTWTENGGDGCAIYGRGTGSPPNTMSPMLRPTSVPSGILILTAVWNNRHGRKIGVCPIFWGGGGSSAVADIQLQLHLSTPKG